jgi:DNA mismatch endonuclease (patch repair protein)
VGCPTELHRRANSVSRRDAFPDVPAEVRRRMSKIKKTHTKPELMVRRIAHRLGYRFRLHRRDLPGSPDLVFPSRRKVVFVHGCFWHRHNCPLSGALPSTRVSYWTPKLERNVERDAEVRTKLQALGWEVLVLWECEIANADAVEQRLRNFLGWARH